MPGADTVGRVKAPPRLGQPLSARSHGDQATRTVTAPGRATRSAGSALPARTTLPGGDTSGTASRTRNTR